MEMSAEYNVGDRVTVKSTTHGTLDGAPDIGSGTIVEIWSNRGARTLVIKVDGLPGRFLRLDEQASAATQDATP